MAKQKSNSDDNSESKPPMNSAKARAQNLERRLWEVSAFEVSEGNRRRATSDEIFDQANIFRRMIECRIFQDIDDVESTVFERWGLNLPPVSLEFSRVDPPSGG